MNIEKAYEREVRRRGVIVVPKGRRREWVEERLYRIAVIALRYIEAVVGGEVEITKENLFAHQERYRASKYVLDQYLGKPAERVVQTFNTVMPIKEIRMEVGGKGEVKDEEITEKTTPLLQENTSET